MESEKKSTSMLNYSLIVMAVTHTFTHAFQQIHTALFPILKSPEEFNLSYQQIGLIAAIPPLCQALLSIPTGLLSDRFGSKKMVLVSVIVAALGAVIASRAQSPWMLIVGVSLLLVNTTIYHPAAYSFTTLLFQARDRSKALGVHGAGGTLGMAIGPISVTILMGFFALTWRQVYLFWIIPLIAGMFAVLRIQMSPREEMVDNNSRYAPEEETTRLLSLNLVMFLVFIGIRMMGGGMISSFLSIFLVENKGVTPYLASLIFGSNYLMGLVAAPLGGFMAARYGEKRWLMLVLFLSYVSLGVALVVPNTIVFVILWLVNGFFNFLGMAANSSIMAQLTPSRQRGLGYGLFFLPGSIMGAVAPMIAAFIAENFGLINIFYASLAVYLVGLAVLQFGVKTKSP
jgi:MFS family permease